MKRLIALVIKLAIVGGIGYAAYSTNPAPAKHKEAIDRKMASLEDQDILAQTDRIMYGDQEITSEESPLTYHTYYVFSKVTGPDGEMASYGFFNKVFVTKSEL